MGIQPKFLTISERNVSLLGSTSSSLVVRKDGKKYKVEEKIIQHGTVWKVWQGTQAFFLTLFSFGIGLAFQALRDKWKKAVNGEEKTITYKRIPPKILSTAKVAQIGPAKLEISPLDSAFLTPSEVNPKNVTDFIDAAKTNITKISFDDLEKGLNTALTTHSFPYQPEDKTTLLVVAERVAQHYIKNANFSKALEVRMRAAQTISPAPPLSDLHTRLKNEHLKLGLRIHPVDTSLFKNHMIMVQKRKFDNGTSCLHFNAKLSHPARAKLQTSLDQIQPDLLLKALPKNFCTKIHIENQHTTYHGRLPQGSKNWEGNFSSSIALDGFEMITHECKVIDFEGIGKVKIGNNPYCRTEYNRITIDLDPSISEAEAADKLNIMCAVLGLGPVASSSRTEDIERIKIMQLFRAFYPQEAYTFERDAVSFEESIESLKHRIAAKVPEMKNHFQHYLIDHPEDLYQQEVYPGQAVWCVKGLAEALKKEGALGLMSGLTGTGGNFNAASKRLASILKSGVLSTQDRFQAGIMAKGASAKADLESGGAESAFARMITNKMPKEAYKYALSGDLQILYDLKLVERVGYVYAGDCYGSKEAVHYQYRSNVINLTKKIQSEPYNYLNNEICIRNRIGPEFIKGVLVNSADEKNVLINTLRQEGVLTKNSLNQECFNNIPINDFIHVGKNFEANYWA